MKKSSSKDPFRIYRGQDLSRHDLIQISQAKGGLISFNNFLSTSRDESIALFFARHPLESIHIPLVFYRSIIIIHPIRIDSRS